MGHKWLHSCESFKKVLSGEVFFSFDREVYPRL